MHSANHLSSFKGGALSLCPLLLRQMQARREKARDLLQRGWQPHMSTPKYDPEQALVLCRQHSYRPGLVLLYEKKRLYREVLQVRWGGGSYKSRW